MRAIGERSGVLAAFILFLALSGLGAEEARLEASVLRPLEEPGMEGAWERSLTIAADARVSGSEPAMEWEELAGFELIGTSVRPLSRSGGFVLDLSFRPPPSGPLIHPALRLRWAGGGLTISALAREGSGIASAEADAGLRGGLARKESELERLNAWFASLPADARKADLVGEVSLSVALDREDPRAAEPLTIRLELQGRAAFLKAQDPRLRLSGKASEGWDGSLAPRREPSWEGPLAEAEGSMSFSWRIFPGEGDLSVEFAPYMVWDPVARQTQALRVESVEVMVAAPAAPIEAEALGPGGRGPAPALEILWFVLLGMALVGAVWLALAGLRWVISRGR